MEEKNHYFLQDKSMTNINPMAVKEYLGYVDAVLKAKKNGRNKYQYRCPKCKKPTYITDKLNDHLEKRHSDSPEEALLIQTKMRAIFTWTQKKSKSGIPLPLPCEICKQWYSRLDTHIDTSDKHKGM